MILVAAKPMTKKSEPERHCEYASIKVDAALIRHLKIAAANADTTIQEIASDLLNEALSGKKDGNVIDRLPPPPKKRGPKKSAD